MEVLLRNCRRKIPQPVCKGGFLKIRRTGSRTSRRPVKDQYMKLLYRTVRNAEGFRSFFTMAPTAGWYGAAGESGSAVLRSADMVCTEAQDVLSAGKKLPFSWKPTLNMKLGQYAGTSGPLGSSIPCPGMVWRHTGLRRRNEFWLSQIPAANGQLWHSLTGFDAVITAKGYFGC